MANDTTFHYHLAALFKASLRRQHQLFIYLLVLLLSGCSHNVSQDGPPDFYIDESRIPDAIPKIEPLAKYGNMKSYRVFGKRYFVMNSNANYEAVGIASWYGTKFHRRRTSSGEPYNLLGMTAAHKTLPLPTYVEVTNLKNQRKVIVKVNDRGPFHSNRLIDLSYVAAKKLGMVGHGTTMVKVKAIVPGMSRQPISVAHHTKQPFSFKKWWGPSANKTVYLQVGAFRNRENAMKLQQRLIALLTSPVHIANPSYQSKLYRVKIGPFRDNLTADKMSKRLRGLGIASSKQWGNMK